jgi:hypothetical protein
VTEGVGVGDGAPPFAVQRIVPPSPTVIPRSASLAKETSLRLAEAPLVWSVHVVPECRLTEAPHVFPPSVVLRMTPPSPTAVPLLPSVNETARRFSIVPLGCVIQ